MLTTIRERASGIVTGIIIALLCIPFIFVGVQGYDSTPIEDLVAKVGDQDINGTEFQRYMSDYRRAQRLQNPQLSAAVFDSPAVKLEALQTMIDRNLMTGALTDAGFTVPASQLRAEIESLPAFQVAGQFNPEVYLMQLEAANRSVDQFQQELTEQLLLQSLPGALSSSAFITNTQMREYVRLRDQTRSAQYVVVGANDFTDEAVIEPEAVTGYYDNNAARYQSDETVTIEYLELTRAAFEGDVEVTEATLKDVYERSKARYIVPEQRLASHILIEAGDDEEAAQARAEELATQAKAAGAEGFAELAGEVSDDVGSKEFGGDLGWIERGMMAEIEDALFAGEAGEIVGPIKSNFGYHVVWIREVDPSRGKTFEEARAEIDANYREGEADRMFVEQQDRLLDLTYEDGTTLEPGAEELGLEIKTEGPFTRFGGQGIAANTAVRDAAFDDVTLLEGLTSEPIGIDDTTVVFLRVIEHKEPETLPLEDVRERIEAQLKREKSIELAREAAEALFDRYEGGESLEDLIADTEREIQAAENAGRTGSGLDSRFVNELFKLPRPGDDGATKHLVPYANEFFALVALESVTDGAFVSDDGGTDFLRTRLQQEVTIGELQGFQSALRASTDIQINTENL